MPASARFLASSRIVCQRAAVATDVPPNFMITIFEVMALGMPHRVAAVYAGHESDDVSAHFARITASKLSTARSRAGGRDSVAKRFDPSCCSGLHRRMAGGG